jgi:hypothetical protein
MESLPIDGRIKTRNCKYQKTLVGQVLLVKTALTRRYSPGQIPKTDCAGHVFGIFRIEN